MAQRSSTLISSIVLPVAIVLGFVGFACSEQCASEVCGNSKPAKSFLQIAVDKAKLGKQLTKVGQQADEVRGGISPNTCKSAQSCLGSLRYDNSLDQDSLWTLIGSNEKQKKCLLEKTGGKMLKVCDAWKKCMEQDTQHDELEAYLRATGLDRTSSSTESCVRAPGSLLYTPCSCITSASEVCQRVVNGPNKGKKWNTMVYCYRAGLCLQSSTCDAWKDLKCSGKLITKMKDALKENAALAQTSMNKSNMAEALHARARASENVFPGCSAKNQCPEFVACSKHSV